MLKKIVFTICLSAFLWSGMSIPATLFASTQFSYFQANNLTKAEKVWICAELEEMAIWDLNTAFRLEKTGAIIFFKEGASSYKVFTSGGTLIAILESDNI